MSGGDVQVSPASLFPRVRASFGYATLRVWHVTEASLSSWLSEVILFDLCGLVISCASFVFWLSG